MTRTNAWLAIPDTFAATLIARAGFDSVTLDLQHGLFDEAAVARTLLALSAPLPTRYVRVPSKEEAVIGKVLDAGADGVIVPMVNSAEDARAVLDAARYPPLGRRSFGPIQAALRAGARPYAKFAAAVEVLAMIETAAAVDAAEAIAGTDGITGLYVGPSDLAISLGHAPGADREEDDVLHALEQIARLAKRRGKTAGIYCQSPAYARRMTAFGYDLVTIATDSSLLVSSAQAALEAFASPARVASDKINFDQLDSR